MKIINIEIRSAKNVGKVWISRKQTFPQHLEPFQTIFSMDWKNKRIQKSAYFPWLGQLRCARGAPRYPRWRGATGMHLKWSEILWAASKASLRFNWHSHEMQQRFIGDGADMHLRCSLDNTINGDAFETHKKCVENALEGTWDNSVAHSKCIWDA